MSLNWGIISAGLISQDFVAALKTLNPNLHKIIAVGARNIIDAKIFAEKFSIDSYYDSYEQVFENKKVNIVYVGNVNNKHKEACLKAIQGGKHVLCEKPMTVNCIEQEEVLSLAKEKGVFFMEAIWTRFFPVVERLKEELRIGTIGEVKIVQANFFVNIKNVERVRNKELGGGGVLDIGIYPIQFACFIFNHEEPIEINVSGHLMPSGVDECMNITLKYSNKKMAIIGISTNCCPTPHGSAIIGGEKGCLQIPSNLWCPTELILSNGEKLVFPIENCESIKTNFSNSIGLSYQAEAVRKAINEGLKEHPFMTHNNSRLIMKIIEEAKRQVGYI